MEEWKRKRLGHAESISRKIKLGGKDGATAQIKIIRSKKS